jgi:hypothetical protein
MEIRRLTELDAESYRQLRHEALEREPLAFTESAAEHQATTLETIKSRLASADDNFVLGAFIDRQLIGWLDSRSVGRSATEGDPRVYVSEECRGRALAGPGGAGRTGAPACPASNRLHWR